MVVKTGEVGLKYGLEAYSPLDDAGRYLPIVEYFAGLNVLRANPVVIEKLRERGALLQEGKISHSYPYCWRCKEPVIFRATTQWFISMEANNLRARVLDDIDSKVEWIPAWGRERIHSHDRVSAGLVHLPPEAMGCADYRAFVRGLWPCLERCRLDA